MRGRESERELEIEGLKIVKRNKINGKEVIIILFSCKRYKTELGNG